MLGSTSIPARVSSVMMLPLVQLLSQPSSALHLLDHAQALSDSKHRAETLLEQLQASHNDDLGWRDGTTPSACSGSLSCMAESMRQYLHVARQPALIKAWLETMAQGKVLSSQQSEYLALLVAALASSYADNLQVFTSALKALNSLAEALPSLVRL